MSFDVVFAFLILIAVWLGYRASLLGAAISAAVLAVVGLSTLISSSALVLVGLGVWLAALVFLATVWRAKGASLAMRLSGLVLGAGQGAAAVILLAGTLLGTVYQGIPAAAEHLRQAELYKPVFRLAQSADLAGAGVAFPDPIEATRTVRTPIAPVIDWAEARPFTSGAIRSLPGEVRALDRTPLAFEVEGRVTSVAVDIGDYFQAGDVLAQLDTDLLEIALQERRAALIEAEARLDEARQDYERQSILFARNVVSESVVETVAASLDAARSRYEIALRGIETAEDRLDDATLRAPYDGTVAARLIEPAQTVAAGSPVLEIQSNGGGFEVTANVPDTVVSRLELGTEHQITLLDRSEGVLNGVLEDIGARASSAAGFPVALRVSDADATLRSGTSVEIAFRLNSLTDGRNLIAVPVNAIWSDGGQGHGVFVYDQASGTLNRRSVTLAGTEGGMALVSDGLAEGDVVASRGIPFLKDGMRVHLRGTGTVRYDQ